MMATQIKRPSPLKNRIKQLASIKLLPDFIILGAQKCGTGSLYNYLCTHPAVLPAVCKEVHYFDNNYDKGTDWYRNHFRILPNEYCIKKLQGRPLITGEASPEYLIHPLAPKRIQQLTPRARLIVLLRNPVDRAYSQYQHNLREKTETLGFEEALDKEPERIGGELERIVRNGENLSYPFRKFSYHFRGVYVDQLKHWFETFPREQILILEFEQLCSQPAAVYRQTLDFLGLPSHEPPAYGKSNYFGGYNEMPPETHRRLSDYYAPHNARLFDLLGRTFDW